MPSNADAWKKRRPRRESHGTACGEKGRSSAWDQGETPVSRDGKCESTKCRTHDERVGGRVTSPANAGGIGLGSYVEGRATGTRRYRGPACVREPTSWPLLDRSAGMRNRTEQNTTPTEASLLSRRVRRAGLNPSTASRSGKALIPVGLTVRRAALDPMRSFPGLGRTLQVSRAGNSGKA